MRSGSGDSVSTDPATQPVGTKGLRFKLSALIAVVVSIVVLALAWSFSSLREWLDVDRTVVALHALADQYGLIVAALAFAAALIFAAPLTFLTLVVMVAFGPLSGIVCVMVGAQVSALCSYGLGAVLGRDVLRKLGGERVNRVSQRLANHGLLAVIAVRMVPVAPFAVINMIAGASHIGLRDLLLGTLLGMAPGTLAIALFIDTLIEAVRNPTSGSGIAAGVALIFIGVCVWLAKLWLRKKE
jgi:uncharacterized membrane protein YdjX (TVP38/TMEM64 family)